MEEKVGIMVKSLLIIGLGYSIREMDIILGEE